VAIFINYVAIVIINSYTVYYRFSPNYQPSPPNEKNSYQTSSFLYLKCEVHNNSAVHLNQISLNMTVKDENDPVNQLLDKVRPHVAKLTFGSIVGYCSGAAAKKIGRALAVLCGLGFIAIQSGEL